MLKSITDNWDDINKVMAENGESKRLLLLNITTLTVLVELCKSFEVIFKKLQVCSYPSLYFVLPSIYKVKCLCSPNENDIPAISALKEKITNYTDTIWVRNLSIWHRVAFFLFPPAVHKQPNDIEEMKEFCISQITNFCDCSSISQLNSLTTTSYLRNSEKPESSLTTPILCEQNIPNTPSVASNNQDNQFFFSNWLNTSTNTFTQSINDEVEKYSREVVNMTDDFDLMQWWMRNEKYYPRLCKLALQVHSIPASSAASERAFSLAGNILTEKRNRLGPKSLDSLLFLNSFLKNISL